MAGEIGTLWVRIAARMDEFDKAQRQVRRSLHSLSDAAEKAEQSLGRMSLKAGAAFAGLAYAIKKTVDEGNRFQNALIGLSNFAQNAGISMDAAKKAAESLAADGLMPVADAATSLKNLLAAGFNLDQAITLVNRFKDSAAFGRQASLSFGEAVRSATEGIKNGNSILVDNAGITKNLSVMLQEAGYSAQDLMRAGQDAGVRMAIFNGIMRESRFQVGDAAKLSGELSGQISGLSTEVSKFSSELKTALEPSLRSLIRQAREMLSGVTEWIKKNPDLAAGLVKATAEGLLFAAAAAKIGQAIAGIIKGISGAGGLVAWLGELAVGFTPFLIGGAIVLGLTAIATALWNAADAAKRAAQDISKFSDVKQLQEHIDFLEKRRKLLLELYSPAAMQGIEIPSGVNKEIQLLTGKINEAMAKKAALEKGLGKPTVTPGGTPAEPQPQIVEIKMPSAAEKAVADMVVSLEARFKDWQAIFDKQAATQEELWQSLINRPEEVATAGAGFVQMINVQEGWQKIVDAATEAVRDAEIAAGFETAEKKAAAAAAELANSLRIENEARAGMYSGVLATTEALRKMKAATEQAWQNLKSMAVNAFLSKAPILQNAIQGAQTGAGAGPIGMAAGAIMGLVSSSQTFATLMNNINPLLQALADAVGMLLEPLLPLITIISTVLSPIFKVLGTILGAVFMPILRAVFPALKLFGLVVLYVAKAIGDVWNGIISAFQGIFRWLGGINIFGWHPLGFLNDWADAMEHAKADTASMAKAIQELTGLTWESAMAKAKEIEATKQATEALRNVPQGFKIALTRWNVALPKYDSGGYVPRTGPAILHAGERVLTPEQQRAGAGGVTINVNVSGPVYGMSDFKRAVREAVAEGARSSGLATYGLAGA